MCQVELQSSYIWLLESTRHRSKDWSHPSDTSWFTEQVTYLFSDRCIVDNGRIWPLGRKWARDSPLKKDRSSLHVSSKKLLYIQLRLKMMTLTEVSEVLVCSWKRISSQALEIAAESKDTLGKGILESPKKSWKNAPSMFASSNLNECWHLIHSAQKFHSGPSWSDPNHNIEIMLDLQ